MNSWIEILQLVLGAGGFLGFIGSIIYFNPRLKSEKASARKADIDVANDAMELVKKLQVELDESYMKINELQEKSTENAQIISEQALSIKVLTRDVGELKLKIDKEVKLKRHSQAFICLREDCDMRNPPLGTYEEPKNK